MARAAEGFPLANIININVCIFLEADSQHRVMACTKCADYAVKHFYFFSIAMGSVLVDAS